MAATPHLVYFGLPSETGLSIKVHVFTQTGEVAADPAGVTEGTVPGIYFAEMPPSVGSSDPLPLGTYLFRFFDHGENPIVPLSQSAVIHWDGNKEINLASIDKGMDGYDLLKANDPRLDHLDADISTRSSHTAANVLSTFNTRLNNIDSAIAGISPPTTSQIRAEMDAALLAYDVPTTDEVTTLIAALAGEGYDPATDSLMAIRDRGDEAWVGGTVTDPGDPGTPSISQSEAYDALCAAINEGALKVEYGDKKVTYRTLLEMQAIKRQMETELGIGDGDGLSGTGKRTYAKHEKHL